MTARELIRILEHVAGDTEVLVYRDYQTFDIEECWYDRSAGAVAMQLVLKGYQVSSYEVEDAGDVTLGKGGNPEDYGS